jgi:hypothetical protein
MTPPHLTEEQLNGFAESTLESPDRAAVAAHLEECPSCRAEVTALRELVSAAGHLPKSIEPPDETWARIRDHLQAPPPKRSVGLWPLGIAAAVLVVVAVSIFDVTPGREWSVVSLSGTPRIGTAVVTGAGSSLEVGEWLETDAVSRARVAVGRIGQVEVLPSTRLRLLEARPTAHRLSLARGAIHAQVDAPPRLFVIETPAGIAIDLGCAYDLQVDSVGRGFIRVTAGWVEFAWRTRRSIVPLGFTAYTRPGIGPGIPFAADAPVPLRESLVAFDFERGAQEAARKVLAAARPEDAVSIWHLLPRVEGRLRADVYERLVTLVPPPTDVTRQGVLALEPDDLDRYWALIRRIAWRREILKGVRDIDPRTGLTK